MPYLVEPPSPPPVIRVSETPQSSQTTPPSDSALHQPDLALPALQPGESLDAIAPWPSPPERLPEEPWLTAQSVQPQDSLPSEASTLHGLSSDTYLASTTLPTSVLGAPLEQEFSDYWQPTALVSITTVPDLRPIDPAVRFPHAPMQFSTESTFDSVVWSPAAYQENWVPRSVETLPTSAFSSPEPVFDDPRFSPLPELDELPLRSPQATIPEEWVASVRLPDALFEQLEQQLERQLEQQLSQPSGEMAPVPLAQQPAPNPEASTPVAPASEDPAEGSPDVEFVRPDPIFAPLPGVSPPSSPDPSTDGSMDEGIDAAEEATDLPVLPPSPPREAPEVDLPNPIPDRPTLVIPEPTLPNPSQPQPAAPAPSTDPLPATDSVTAPEVDVVELTADRQEFNETQQVFIAEGNVVMYYQDSILQADRLRVNLVNRYAIAEGNVIYTQPEQILQGDRMEYNFVRREGTVFNARGETRPQEDPDLQETRRRPVAPADPSLPLEVDYTGSLIVGVGVGRSSTSTPSTGVERIRFEADQIDFIPGGWTASNARFTNDPFSPPELEIRSSQVTFTRISPTRSEIRANNPRMVFDQGFSIPLVRERFIIDEEEDENPLPVQIGFDEDERGGLYIERTFTIVDEPTLRLRVTPQFYLQRGIDEGLNPVDPLLYGVLARLSAQLGLNTSLEGTLELTSLDFTEDDYTEERIRGRIALNQLVGDHTLTLQGVYRDRIFNGSLGFQTVQWSYGLLLTSPSYQLGNTGITLVYQAGIQEINATIARDRRDDLLPPPDERENSRATLTRYQIGAVLTRTFPLWEGEPLPATREAGLRYTPTPLVPYINLVARLRAFASFYSSGDTQPVLTTSLGVVGQLGHLSRSSFDYLAFNLTYSFTPDGPESPFNFDRLSDRQVISGGAVVQLFGPVLVGFQTSYSLDNDEEINTDFILQYQRRTYSAILRFSPQREEGTLGIQINDFNWVGQTEPFAGSGTTRFSD